VRPKGLRKLNKKCIHVIGSRTRAFQARSTVPYRTEIKIQISYNIKNFIAQSLLETLTSANRKIINLSLNPKFCYRVHSRESLVLIMSSSIIHLGYFRFKYAI
jgi:hypothetical protein